MASSNNGEARKKPREFEEKPIDGAFEMKMPEEAPSIEIQNQIEKESEEVVNDKREDEKTGEEQLEVCYFLILLRSEVFFYTNLVLKI